MPKELLEQYPEQPVVAGTMLPKVLRSVADVVQDAVDRPADGEVRTSTVLPLNMVRQAAQHREKADERARAWEERNREAVDQARENRELGRALRRALRPWEDGREEKPGGRETASLGIASRAGRAHHRPRDGRWRLALFS